MKVRTPGALARAKSPTAKTKAAPAKAKAAPAKAKAAPVKAKAKATPAEGKAAPLKGGPSGNSKKRLPERWKLFWCETWDHDEDWFVVARSRGEAACYHEDAEGYDVAEAKVKLVCVLPDSEQSRYKEAAWPVEETLLACGAEFLPRALEDEHAELRAHMGVNGRVVRIQGKVYCEGDIVSNTLHRMGRVPIS